MKQKFQELLIKLKMKFPVLETYFEQISVYKLKIVSIIDDLKLKNPVIEKLFAFVQNIFTKQRIIKKKPKKTHKQNVFKQKLLRMLKTGVSFVGIGISSLGLIFFLYCVYDYYSAKSSENVSVYLQTVANMNHASAYVLNELKFRPIKRKYLGSIINSLNEVDDFGRVKRFSPCDPEIEAYGKKPAPGNVVIAKPHLGLFKIIAHNCDGQPVLCRTIKVKETLVRKKKNSLPKHSENKTIHPVVQTHSVDMKTHAPHDSLKKPQITTEEHPVPAITHQNEVKHSEKPLSTPVPEVKSEGHNSQEPLKEVHSEH